MQTKLPGKLTSKNLAFSQQDFAQNYAQEKQRLSDISAENFLFIAGWGAVVGLVCAISVGF